MKSVVNHADLGEIVYEESFWSGRKSLSGNSRGNPASFLRSRRLSATI